MPRFSAYSSMQGRRVISSSFCVIPQRPEYLSSKDIWFKLFNSEKILSCENFLTPVMKTKRRFALTLTRFGYKMRFFAEKTAKYRCFLHRNRHSVSSMQPPQYESCNYRIISALLRRNIKGCICHRWLVYTPIFFILSETGRDGGLLIISSLAVRIITLVPQD